MWERAVEVQAVALAGRSRGRDEIPKSERAWRAKEGVEHLYEVGFQPVVEHAGERAAWHERELIVGSASEPGSEGGMIG